jgi:hypothetical protein
MNENTITLELRDAVNPEALLPGHGLWWWWVVAGVLALAVGMVVFMLLIRGKVKPPDPALLRESAYREALAALSQNPPADTREAAVLASLSVRKYLSVAAADPALFETHEEFVSRHDALQALMPEARDAATAGFARLAALKYAPVAPDLSASGVLTESRELLQTLHRGFAA